jgi:hypothetical protein
MNKAKSKYLDGAESGNNSFTFRDVHFNNSCKYYIVIDSDDISDIKTISNLNLILNIEPKSHEREIKFSGEYFVCNWGDGLSKTNYRYARKIEITGNKLQQISFYFKADGKTELTIKRVQIVESCFNHQGVK